MIQIKNRLTGVIVLEVETLMGADLSYADLSDADLRGADLSDADLMGADLSDADLRGADLMGADLRGANIDFSCLHFSCRSRKPKTDRRQRVQLAHHLLSWMKYADNLGDDEKQIFDAVKAYANEFHRTDVEKF